MTRTVPLRRNMSPRKSQRLASAAAVATLPVATGEPQQNRRQPSSTNKAGAPQSCAAHMLEVAQQTGFSVSPDAHDPARLAGAQDTALRAKRGASSWNASHRYYSKTSSFPDYGSYQSTMGPERLKRMNQSWSSVNTLTTSGNKRALPVSSSAPHQVFAKRQKLELCSAESPLPESSYQASPPNLGSTFKGRNQAAQAGPERAPRRVDSLVDTQNPGPPPSNVASDLVPRLRVTNSRAANTYSPTLSKHKVIGHKTPLELEEIEISEDELQSKSIINVAKTRRTNFSQIQPSPRSRRCMRGDITQTKFEDRTPRRPIKPSVVILKAVSGKNMYHSPDSRHCLSLHCSPSDPSLLEAWSNGTRDEHYQWASINVKHVHNVRYGGCYLSLRRPMSRGRPPAMTMQFESAEGAAQVARLIDEHATQDNTREEMKQILDIAWENAVSSSRHVSHEGTDQQRVHMTRERTERQDDTQKKPKSREDKTMSLPGRLTKQERHDDTQQKPKSREDKTMSLPGRLTKQERHDDPPKKLNSREDTTMSLPGRLTEQERSASPVQRTGMQTRRTRRTWPTCEETRRASVRWSEENTGWKQNWERTLVYPATGRNRASVDKEDIPRLDEGQFLNDNLINFYLRYLQTEMERDRPDLFGRIHIFSTFFFEKLTSCKGGINYDGVKGWTSKLDLFSYDYILVPVNEHAHWYISILYNIPKLIKQGKDDTLPINTSTDVEGLLKPELQIMATVEQEISDISLEDSATRRSPRQLLSGSASSPAKTVLTATSPTTVARRPRGSQRQDSSRPRIVTLDSMGNAHSATCKVLKEYLLAEAKDKKKIDLETVPGGMKAPGVPMQNNYCDCGVFVLGYMKAFLKDPDELMHKILSGKDIDWSIDPASLRNTVRDLLFTLQKEQAEHIAQQRKAKRVPQQRKANATQKLAVGTASTSDAAGAASPRAGGVHQCDKPRRHPTPQLEPAPSSPFTRRRSVTPPMAAMRSRGVAREETLADDGVVDIVRMPPDASQPGPFAQ